MGAQVHVEISRGLYFKVSSPMGPDIPPWDLIFPQIRLGPKFPPFWDPKKSHSQLYYYTFQSIIIILLFYYFIIKWPGEKAFDHDL
jgi:hypothetical protein